MAISLDMDFLKPAQVIILNTHIPTTIISRAVVGGPAGQAMAGPVFSLTKQYL